MKDLFLEKSRDLDKVMRESNGRMIKLKGSEQEKIDKAIYYSLGCIRDVIVDMILSYDENVARRQKFSREYDAFIDSWNKFTSENVSPSEAGVRLEGVRRANLTLMAALERKSPHCHLKVIK